MREFFTGQNVNKMDAHFPIKCPSFTKHAENRSACQAFYKQINAAVYPAVIQSDDNGILLCHQAYNSNLVNKYINVSTKIKTRCKTNSTASVDKYS